MKEKSLLAIISSLIIAFSAGVRAAKADQCQFGALIRVGKKRVKVVFSPLDLKRGCLKKTRYKNFFVTLNNLEDDILLKNKKELANIKNALTRYPNDKRVLIFDKSFYGKNNSLEFRNNLKKYFKATATKVTDKFIKDAMELDFKLNSTTYFSTKRTALILFLKEGKSFEIKGINNFDSIKNWKPLKEVPINSKNNKYTQYVNKASDEKFDFTDKFNNSTQNFFFFSLNLFENSFFLDIKTKITPFSANDLEGLSTNFNKRVLTDFIKGTKSARHYFFHLDWERYYFILNS